MPRLTKKQGGLAAIEFVLLLPLLLLIGWVSVDFGRLIFQYDALTKTTRDAARYLAAATRPTSPAFETDPTYQAAVAQTINLALCGSISACNSRVVPDLETDNIVIDYPASTVAGINYVRVSVTDYSVTFLTNQIADLLGIDVVNLGDISVTMRQIQQ
ncbi:MAG: TadE/TadG family type IV pilus assembly protein [Pseudomonadota bacterium]